MTEEGTQASPQTTNERGARNEQWTPISAYYEPPYGIKQTGDYVVIYVRNRGDGWEFGRERIDEREFLSVEVFGDGE